MQLKSTLRLLLAVVVLAGTVYYPVTVQAAFLREGMTGGEIATLQRNLAALGYEAGEADGVYGPVTAQAVRDFQFDYNLAVDGIAGEQTLAALSAVLARSEPVSRAGPGRIERIIATAMRFIGVPYVFGGEDPGGFDCSGFIQYIFALNGISLPRTADMQYLVGVPVSRSSLRRGDLVFFSTYAPGPSHDGIYLGNGRFISATSSRGVTTDNLNSAYWAQRYVGARRIVR